MNSVTHRLHWHYPAVLIALALTFLSLSIFFGQGRIDQPVASQPKIFKGILDLNQWDSQHLPIFDLNGQWEFYPHRFLSPNQPLPSELQPCLIEVPSLWNRLEACGKTLTGHGWGTYRLMVLLPKKKMSLALIPTWIQTSYRLFINGELLGKSGRPGKSMDETLPKHKLLMIDLIPPEQKLEILIHVANFHHQKGGIRHPIRFGLHDEIKRIYIQGIALDLFTLGAITIMAFYHFGLFALRRNEPAHFWFALFCLIVSFRVLINKNMFLLELWPNFPYEMRLKIEYLTFFLAAPILFAFLSRLYPKEFNLILRRTFQLLGVFYALFVLAFQSHVYSHLAASYRVILVLGAIFALYCIIKAYNHKRSGSGSILIGSTLLIVTLINDVLYASEMIESGYMIHYGLFAFILLHSYAFFERYSLMFDKVKKLSASNQELATQLMQSNINLEQKVVQRTIQLQALNANLEQRVSQEVAIRREKEELLTQQSKMAAMGEMISIITHQWRQPLSSIASLAANLRVKLDLGLDYEQAQPLLDAVDEQVLFLSNTISDFRNFMRPERKPVETRLDHILTNALKIIGQSLKSSGIQWKLDCHFNQQIVTHANEVIHVLINILKNAMDQLQARKIIDPVILIRGYETEQVQVLEFIDNAGGIEQDSMEHIFDRYFTTKGEQKGTGLGLYMARTIVQKHCGGELIAKNMDNGACFILQLPLVKGSS